MIEAFDPQQASACLTKHESMMHPVRLKTQILTFKFMKIGPANSWGIHGLWPDDCDGDYSEECDSSRAYTDITQLIEEYGTTQLLDDMNTYWNSDDESNEDFWEHEWYSHGTCVSTLDPSCYTDYETGIEAVDFFQITVDLFKTLVCS